MFGELGFSTRKSRIYFVFAGRIAKDRWYGVGLFSWVSSFLGLFYTPTQRMRCFVFIKMYNYLYTLPSSHLWSILRSPISKFREGLHMDT